MRFLLAGAAALLAATSTAAADNPRVIPPKPAPPMTSPSPAQAERGSEPSLARPQIQAKLIDPTPDHCPELPNIAARKRDRSLSPDKLTELPPGEAYHAIYRRDSRGCIDPLLVREQNREGR